MRILHVFRNPVGGLFRHVRDLARGQSELGHQIGIFCDSRGGGSFADTLLDESKVHCSLGIYRIPISRAPGWGDVGAINAVMNAARRTNADVIHGHGAKGGLYARVAGWRLGKPSTYTPHAGSLNYDWDSAAGKIYLSAEKVLRGLGSGMCFVCRYEEKAFDSKIGIRGKPFVTVFNGLWPEDFKPAVPQPDATDFVTLGEIRPIKGLDVLMRALVDIEDATVTFVGDGPARAEYEALARELELSDRVRFVGSKPWTEAVNMGRIMVLPSRNESFPYVVLEAAAAGLPLVATDVGGISEIAPAEYLCKPDDVESLRTKMIAAMNALRNNKALSHAFTADVKARCDAGEMCKKLVQFYTTLKV
jgi:glycosyltransferase involved in cell wall biosynthesis